MPELRDRYDDGAVSNWIIQPPLADLQDRARRRTRRHRAASAVGVAVVAGLVAVPLLTLPGDGGGPAGQSPPGLARPGPSFPPVYAVATALEFYDLDHGYAAYRLDNDCQLYLSSTRDGGSNWSRLRELPGTGGSVEDDTSCLDHRVIPVAPETLVFPGVPPGGSWADFTRGFISRDAGVTWQEYRPELRTADALPPAVTPEVHCRDRDCAEVSLGWYDPQTGNLTVLRTPPPVAVADSDGVDVARAADGSIWVAGIGSGLDHQISVSRDDGQNWQVSPLPGSSQPSTDPDSTDGRGVVVATADGRTGYVVPWQSTGDGSQGSLYRTTDAGRSWQQVGEANRFRNVDSIWVSPDATLSVVDGDNRHTRVSTDGGASFTTAGRALFQVEQIVGGFAGWAPDGIAGVTDGTDGAVSADGLTWHSVQLPSPELTTTGPR